MREKPRNSRMTDYPWRTLDDIREEAGFRAGGIFRTQSLWRLRKSRLKRWWQLLNGNAPKEFIIDPKTGNVRLRRGLE